MARQNVASWPTGTRRPLGLVGAPALAAAMLAVTGPALAAPTCSEFPQWETHGDHVINDYVTEGHVGWPPDGSELGAGVAGKGMSAPGGPAHFDMDVPPGASFCVDSRAPSVPRP